MNAIQKERRTRQLVTKGLDSFTCLVHQLHADPSERIVDVPHMFRLVGKLEYMFEELQDVWGIREPVREGDDS